MSLTIVEAELVLVRLVVIAKAIIWHSGLDASSPRTWFRDAGKENCFLCANLLWVLHIQHYPDQESWTSTSPLKWDLKTMMLKSLFPWRVWHVNVTRFWYSSGFEMTWRFLAFKKKQNTRHIFKKKHPSQSPCCRLPVAWAPFLAVPTLEGLLGWPVRG